MKVNRKSQLSMLDVPSVFPLIVLARHIKKGRTKSLEVRSRVLSNGHVEAVFQVFLNGKPQQETKRVDSALYWYNKMV